MPPYSTTARAAAPHPCRPGRRCARVRKTRGWWTCIVLAHPFSPLARHDSIRAPRSPRRGSGMSRRPLKRGKPTRGWTLGHRKIRRLSLERGRPEEGLALWLPSLSDAIQSSGCGRQHQPGRDPHHARRMDGRGRSPHRPAFRRAHLPGLRPPRGAVHVPGRRVDRARDRARPRRHRAAHPPPRHARGGDRRRLLRARRRRDPEGHPPPGPRSLRGLLLQAPRPGAGVRAQAADGDPARARAGARRDGEGARGHRRARRRRRLRRAAGAVGRDARDRRHPPPRRR